MSNTIGQQIKVTLFGESHGEMIGAILDGLPGGVKIDLDFVQRQMYKRKAAGSISTPRNEADQVKIVSGVKDGYSEGTPITILIENTNVRSKDYENVSHLARPGHADYTGHIKYNGFEDARGGGHFSGRLTAPLVASGAIVQHMLQEKGIYIGTHIAQIADVKDDNFDETNLKKDIDHLYFEPFPVLNYTKGERMKERIEEARMALDSVGGILDTAIIGLPAGIGEPSFDALESTLAKAMFSIPAIKGIQFGLGFDFVNHRGSFTNDVFYIDQGVVKTKTNHNGGINGGISNGMPIRFQTVVKPTSSIAQAQDTIDYKALTNGTIEVHGRHDPCIVHRARIVVDAMSALVIGDALAIRYGYQYFGGTK